MDFFFANKDVFMIDTTDYSQYRAEEEARKGKLRELLNQLSAGESGFDGALETIGTRGEHNLVADEDEKENFLMPAPKARPPRNRKRNTKDALESVRMSKSSRVTRSSRINESIMHEETTVAKKGRKTKSTVKESLMKTQDTSISGLDTSDISGESRKSRRTTRKGKENPLPRVPTRATRASTRASTRTSTRTSTRASSKRKTSILELKNTPEPKRLTRSKAANSSTRYEIEECHHIPEPSISHTSKKNRTNVSQAELFSPYGKNSVKERVEAFEGLSSVNAVKGENVNRTPKVTSPIETGSLPSNIPLISITSATASSSSEKRVCSPLVKSKSKKGQKKIDVVVETLKEEAEQDASPMEYQEDGLCKEVVDSPFVVDQISVLEESKNTETPMADLVPLKKNKGKKTPEDDGNETDDEWMTDDECSKTPKNKLIEKGGSVSSSTPKVKPSSSKVSQDAVGSYKALRSRKVTKVSDVSLTLSAKVKTPKVASLVKPEIDNDGELKRLKEEERQKEALKRKEELLKKRTEVIKKNREEKSMKVKRTREEKEKEIAVKKHKAAKAIGGKKKKAAVAEEESKKAPVKVVTPPENEPQDLNSTYAVPVTESKNNDTYNMTPHWRDAPPKQTNNPNDFGVADNSDCSSGEEADPRKKIPSWAQLKPNDKTLLTQCLLPALLVNAYWQTKPRAPTIQEFFGTHVSSKTLRRGVNYRTSSALWNTPPLRN